MSMGYFSCFWLQGGEDAFVLAFVPLILCISHVSVCRDECGGSFSSPGLGSSPGNSVGPSMPVCYCLSLEERLHFSEEREEVG